MNTETAVTWKEGLARLMQFRPMSHLMAWGIKLVVPRQRVGVGLVAFNDKEQVLLLRHVFHPISPWGLPGGWLGRNEAPQVGVARELMEETGLEVKVGPSVHVTHENDPGSVSIVYLGWIRPGTVRLSHEILEARWFDRYLLPETLLPVTREVINIAFTHYRMTRESNTANGNSAEHDFYRELSHQ